MRFHRPFLYAGVFLVAIGGIGFAADAGSVDTTVLTTIVRLWPLAIIAIGAALALRRTSLALPAGLAAAVMPGLLIGSGFAALPRITDHCGSSAALVDAGTQQGTFSQPAAVSIETGCGSVVVGAAAGRGWQVRASNTTGEAPDVVANLDALTITPGQPGWDLLTGGRHDWQVTLPTQLGALSVVANAGRANIGLAGATLETLVVDANLADVAVDLSSTEIGQVVAIVNLGHASVVLPPGSDMEVRLDVDAGDIDLCVPQDAGLHVSNRGSPRTFTFEGVRQSGGDWLSPRYDTAAYRFEIVASVNVGSIDINPVGGCR